MTKRGPVKIEPTYDAPYTVALNELTGFDHIAIKAHYKRPYEDLSASERAVAMCWVFENRRLKALEPPQSVSWDTINSWTGAQHIGYWQPEDDEGK